MVAHQYRVVITTIPPEPGLTVRVMDPSEETVHLSGETNDAGGWTLQHGLDLDMLVTLVLESEDGVKVRWHGLLRNLDPMECFLRNPKKLSHDELHKRWRKAERDRTRRGAGLDPDDIAREAYG